MTVGELKKVIGNLDNDAKVVVYNFGDYCTSSVHSVELSVFGNNVVINADRTETLLANYTKAKAAIEYHDTKRKESEKYEV